MGGLVVWSLNFREGNVFILKVEFQLFLGFLFLVSGFKGFIGNNGLQVEFTADLVSNKVFEISPFPLQHKLYLVGRTWLRLTCLIKGVILVLFLIFLLPMTLVTFLGYLAIPATRA